MIPSGSESESNSIDPADDHLDYVLIHEAVALETTPDLAHELADEEIWAQPTSRSGYMMRFVEERHRTLGAVEVLMLPSLKSYPVPESAMESLSSSVQARLDREGLAQVRGYYDQEESRFYGSKLGWDEEVEDWVRISQLLEAGHSLHEAVDYYFVGEQGYVSPERWAQARGVNPESVKRHAREIGGEDLGQ